jgi:hypothetical protein
MNEKQLKLLLKLIRAEIEADNLRHSAYTSPVVQKENSDRCKNLFKLIVKESKIS